jgi:hypothetical protein
MSFAKNKFPASMLVFQPFQASFFFYGFEAYSDSVYRLLQENILANDFVDEPHKIVIWDELATSDFRSNG